MRLTTPTVKSTSSPGKAADADDSIDVRRSIGFVAMRSAPATSARPTPAAATTRHRWCRTSHPWGASANGLEKDWSHAVNGGLVSFLSSHASNEFRFQWAREDRPRPYDGPVNHLGDTTGVSSIFGAAVPFHDTDIDPNNAFRIGLPFFLPIRDDHDTRVQLLDNVSISRGNHLIKLGGEWNRTSTTQVFVGFAGGRMAFSSVHGFENFVNQGSHYIECSNGCSCTCNSRA